MSNLIQMRRKHRVNVDTIAMRSTILTHQTRSISKEQRSKAIDRVNPPAHHNSQTIEEVYGRVNRFRTLKRQKDEPHLTSKTKDGVKVTLNNSKIENSFNNIIINFSERNSGKAALMSSLNSRPEQPRLVAERRVRSKEVERMTQVRRYAKSKVLSERADELSSSSIVVKDKLISLDKTRQSLKSSHNKVRKNDIQTLQDQYRQRGRVKPTINESLGKLESVVSKFVMTFQDIMNQPISLETYETRQMKMDKKMKTSGCNILKRFQRRWLKVVFQRLLKASD